MQTAHAVKVRSITARAREYDGAGCHMCFSQMSVMGPSEAPRLELMFGIVGLSLALHLILKAIRPMLLIWAQCSAALSQGWWGWGGARLLAAGPVAVLLQSRSAVAWVLRMSCSDLECGDCSISLLFFSATQYPKTERGGTKLSLFAALAGLGQWMALGEQSLSQRMESARLLALGL